MNSSENQQPTPASKLACNSDTYDVSDMQFLDDLEHVRRRAGTYIGDLGVRGLHHLVHEVIDNCLDEAMAGFATHLQITIQDDHSISVSDNGRGIPVDFDPRLGKSALECVMTMLKYGGKFGDSAYDTAGGLNGMGLKAVNFLSKWCIVQVQRNGHRYQQKFEQGIATGEVEIVGNSNETGTTVSFLPDPEKFGDLNFDGNLLAKRLQNAAFINPGVHIDFCDSRSQQTESWCFQRGLAEWVEHHQLELTPIHKDVISIQGRKEDVSVDIAFRYHIDPNNMVACYANNIHTEEGGSQLNGFRTSLTRGLLAYARKQKLLGAFQPLAADFWEGLTAIVSVRLSQPEFESQNKVKLTTPAVEQIVREMSREVLNRFWEEHPEVAQAIVAKACVTAQTRIQAKEVRRKLIAKSKGFGGLPGKLRDCTSKDPTVSEIYLVEGDSAGGTAEGGRIREFQAILPLRGKIINAFKYTTEKVLSNQEVQGIIQALGIGVGPDVNIKKLRYYKVIIMSDADVDGSHIRTLLLCFFYRQMPQLITAGHVFIAQPPLFRIRSRNTNEYLQSDEEMHSRLLKRGCKNAVLKIHGDTTIAADQLLKLCKVLESIQRSTTPGEPTPAQNDLLISFGLDANCLTTNSELGNEKPSFEVRTGSTSIGMDSLVQLSNQLRTLGENGIQVTRFKGLGEMNAEELRQTTLLPENRRLVRVTMDDAQKADEMFHLLMGVIVEPRRKFIKEHALDAKLDV